MLCFNIDCEQLLTEKNWMKKNLNETIWKKIENNLNIVDDCFIENLWFVNCVWIWLKHKN